MYIIISVICEFLSVILDGYTRAEKFIFSSSVFSYILLGPFHLFLSGIIFLFVGRDYIIKCECKGAGFTVKTEEFHKYISYKNCYASKNKFNTKLQCKKCGKIILDIDGKGFNIFVTSNEKLAI